MKSSTPQHETADEKASLWAARLDGAVLTADQRIALDAWLETDPSHRALLSQYCQFSADLEQQMPLLAGIRELSAEPQPAQATAQPHPWLRRSLMAGAALTAAAAVALVVWLERPRNQHAQLATPSGHRESLTLVEATRVDLNARTSLEVAIDGTSRHVRLPAGEAFFHVSKDPARPFIVETPAGSVRVTGTQFDVRTGVDGALVVTVAEGSVQVRPGDAGGQAVSPVALTPGDQLVVRAGVVSVRTLSPAALDNALAWRQGQAVFDGVPLADALAQFARYHGRAIAATPEAAALPVGGRFSLDDLDGFLSTLPEVLPVQATRRPDGSVEVALRVHH
ncbi:MAG TPA: FecR domain-containing protein [Lacunisphaera sp.]|jgi:transmembrane sensor|nr:FecR domain-containing protein [Lacunisphaera sp.]